MMRVDWCALLQAAHRHSAILPAQFWALTPVELDIIMGRNGGQPLGRAGLRRLEKAFPDEIHSNKENGSE